MPNIRTKVVLYVTIPSGAEVVFAAALAEHAKALGAKDVSVTTVAERSSEETSVCVPDDEVARDVELSAPCSHDFSDAFSKRRCRKCGKVVAR